MSYASLLTHALSQTENAGRTGSLSDQFPCLAHGDRSRQILIKLLTDLSSREDVFLSRSTLARLFCLPPRALYMRLLRWRERADRGPLRDRDSRCRAARQYYNLRDVLPVIEEMLREGACCDRKEACLDSAIHEN